MGVSTEVWRMRIGGFSRRTVTRSFSRIQDTIFITQCSASSFIALLSIMLFIGNIEWNPGPLYSCKTCAYTAGTISDHVQHQRIHAVTCHNYVFVCCVPSCSLKFLSYQYLTSHVSHCHKEERSVSKGSGFGCSIENCDQKFGSVMNLCHHTIQVHLKEKNEQVKCPIDPCPFSARIFTKPNQLRTHLSQVHLGWRVAGSKLTLQGEVPIPGDDQVAGEVDDLPLWEDEPGDLIEDESDNSDLGGKLPSNHMFDEEMVTDYIAKFYLMLEGSLLIPTSSVQKISEQLAFLTEIVHAHMKTRIEHILTQYGMPPDKINDTVRSVLSVDPLYNTHHKDAPGITLTSSHMRYDYYRKKSKFIEPVEISLKVDPHDRSALVHYIPIKDTLQALLEDPSIQDQIDHSFVDTPSPGIIKDYTSGTVFQGRKVTPKRIDLLLYQDGFTCGNPLGYSGKKYGMLGMYFTLGNLKPHNRSLLKAIRLVLITMERFLTEFSLEKCFKHFLEDLRCLEKEGILYKNEIVPVRLQFILGDNKGQHLMGGLVPAFGIEYFCRFCEYTKTQYKADQDDDTPTFTCAKWRTPKSYCRNLKKVTGRVPDYKGVRKDSPFNSLSHFQVCDPSLPPCLGHDLFIGGVVDCDLAAMLKYFIDEKNWFTYHFINRRINRLKCKGSDSPNKPASVHLGGKKCGGHAVQNWTLLRLLPLIIGDKIVEFNDPVWKLYLLLKRICEFICSPALSVSQVEEMRSMINKYMSGRKILRQKYKPKHHYFSHYPDLFLKFGPLIYLWSMRFEHFHSYFKKVAHVCRNFINLSSTLAFKQQLLQAFQSSGSLFSAGAVNVEAFPLCAEVYPANMQPVINRLSALSPGALDVECMTLNGICYKKGQWFILKGEVCRGSLKLIVGEVKAILYTDGEYKVILDQFKATRCKKLGIFFISESENQFCIKSLSGEINTLEIPCPQPTYEWNDRPCLSLKHVPLVDVLDT